MPYVVSLEGFRPGQRYDGEPWTQARIDQSANEDGPWTLIDTLTLDPVDEDPELPKIRDLTTDLATLPAAWFRVTFLDAGDNQQVATPVFFPDPGLRPSVADVGAQLRVRTKDNAGNYLGTFTDATRPTREEAEKLVDLAVADVAMRIGTNPPLELLESARWAATLRACQLVEISYFPEQTEDRITAYQALRLSYEEVVARLVSACNVRSLFAETEPEEEAA